MSGDDLGRQPTSKLAEASRRLLRLGMHAADVVPGPSAPYWEHAGFGFGKGETVASWIGIPRRFATLADAQAAYPIIQSASDTIDWVVLQTAIDEAIYGALGTGNKGNTARRLFIPAGHYICNRPLHIGYRRAGKPPAALNGNGYVTISIAGEGAQVDPSGNGMTGVTIQFTCPWGFIIHGYQRVTLRGLAVVGPYGSFYANRLGSILKSPTVWDRASWKPAGIAGENWLGGPAVSIGIGADLYTNDASAAAHPARPLPAVFGGGTTTEMFGAVGGTRIICSPDVIVSGFVVGFGRPHGDSNGEFFEFNGDVTMCAHPFVFGHSQGRNHAITNTNCFGFHTLLGSRGGTRGNANLHGAYNNIHAGYGYQIIDHPNADWSGPLTLRDAYLEGAFRIGYWNGVMKLDGAYLSFWEIDGNFGVPSHHFEGDQLVLDNCRLTGLRHGLVVRSLPGSGRSRVVVTNGTLVQGGFNTNFANHPNAAEIGRGLEYMNYILTLPGLNERRVTDCNGIGPYGWGGGRGAGSYVSSMTYVDQEWLDYSPQTPLGDQNGVLGSPEMQGAVQRFAVPKISQWQKRFDFAGIPRSGFDLTVVRGQVGDIKADVGDLLAVKPLAGKDPKLQADTWFVVVSVSGSTMIIRQLNNYYSASQYDYAPNGFEQIDPLAPTYALFEYVCTRIRCHKTFWVGDVSAGSNVIRNVRNGLRYGGANSFTGMDMAVGDFHLHQEPQRAGLKSHNKVTAIDVSARTITLADAFNVTKTAYPLAFYVDVHNS